VEAGELRVVYQPIFELSTNRVMGVEALVRWQHPRRGLLAPGEFLELAERRGRIEEIGDWVLRRATTAISGWNSSLEDEPELILFANLSARELNSPALAGRVASALRASGLDPHHLVLEVTEDTVVEDAELSRDQLSELRSLGVRAAIDDFGAGYFSLAHLRSLPASVIKIDRSLIGSIDRRDSSILRSAVALAHTLALDAVVEGVETAEQLELARAIGCDLAQGFLLARPMPWDGIECLLRARRGPATAPERPAAANGAEPSGSEIAKPLLPDPARLSAELAPFLGDGEARTARARTGVG
jgi:EAL domain-containing protein (putative c-di-GMP-specific phosphodiesterase class I)